MGIKILAVVELGNLKYEYVLKKITQGRFVAHQIIDSLIVAPQQDVNEELKSYECLEN